VSIAHGLRGTEKSSPSQKDANGRMGGILFSLQEFLNCSVFFCFVTKETKRQVQTINFPLLSK